MSVDFVHEDVAKEAALQMRQARDKSLEEVLEALQNYKESRLNALFRCDHSDCTARAVVEATLHSGNCLYFCFHHSETVKDAILPSVSKWYTEEITLYDNRLKGSEN